MKKSKQQQPSEARRAAARANGAKSRGPVTAEGKQRSSRNAVKHGLLARILTLTEADARLYESLQQNYIERFQPRDQPEYDLIEELVYAKWQIRQAWMMHARTLSLQMMADYDELNGEWDSVTMLDRQTLAFAQSLAKSNVLPTLERYIRQLTTQADRAIRMFEHLRSERRPALGDIPLPNEPMPIAQHYSAEPFEPTPERDGAGVIAAPNAAGPLKHPHVRRVPSEPAVAASAPRLASAPPIIAPV
jgi:hypothetical protein